MNQYGVSTASDINKQQEAMWNIFLLRNISETKRYGVTFVCSVKYSIKNSISSCS